MFPQSCFLAWEQWQAVALITNTFYFCNYGVSINGVLMLNIIIFQQLLLVSRPRSRHPSLSKRAPSCHSISLQPEIRPRKSRGLCKVETMVTKADLSLQMKRLRSRKSALRIRVWSRIRLKTCLVLEWPRWSLLYLVSAFFSSYFDEITFGES